MSFGEYQLLEVLGRGAMGIVYRARQRDTGRFVAVKIVDSRAAGSPTLMRRFEQECAAAGRLDHPHIVRALDWGVERGEPYLVMELVEGRTLGAAVCDKGPVRLAKAVQYARQLGEALHLAHQHGLVHRDVKPDNVLMTAGGDVKLGDLGLVKVLQGAADLTAPGACLGTVDFMAPEQFGDAKNVDARCDVYGLAGTVYFALTGARPFPGSGELAIIKKKMRNQLVPAGELVPGVPPGIDAALRQGLDAKPGLRPATSVELAAKLEAALAEAMSQSAGAAAEGGEEERAERRYPARAEARCRRLPGGSQDWSAKIRDVSATGICLELDRRYEPGTILSVALGGEEPTATYLVRVQWVRQVTARRWAVGCAFSRRLTAGELSSLLEHKSPTVVREQPAEPAESP